MHLNKQVMFPNTSPRSTPEYDEVMGLDGLGQGANKIPIRKKAGKKMKLRMLKGGKRTDPALREVMGRMAELADGVGLGRGGGGASSPSQDERREP